MPGSNQSLLHKVRVRGVDDAVEPSHQINAAGDVAFAGVLRKV